MVSKRLQHVLNMVALIASMPAASTVTTQMLSHELGLSVSYLESLLKVLKQGGVLRAYRGPGGGYQLMQDASTLSLWDVLSAFDKDMHDEPSMPQRHGDLLLDDLERGYADKAQAFFAAYPLSKLVAPDRVIMSARHGQPTASKFHLKPLPTQAVPKAPKSVFDWSQFVLAETA